MPHTDTHTQKPIIIITIQNTYEKEKIAVLVIEERICESTVFHIYVVR